VIDEATRRLIRRLATEGQLTLSAIARRVGVSKQSVCNIVKEERPERPPAIEPTTDKCPKCGYIGFVPCTVCAAREQVERSLVVDRFEKRSLEFIAPLDLTDDHRRRYEEIRARQAAREGRESTTDDDSSPHPLPSEKDVLDAFE
jgi:hypothetical protein